MEELIGLNKEILDLRKEVGIMREQLDRVSSSPVTSMQVAVVTYCICLIAVAMSFIAFMAVATYVSNEDINEKVSDVYSLLNEAYEEGE